LKQETLASMPIAQLQKSFQGAQQVKAYWMRIVVWL
jgi:hypothetical protein